MCYVVCIYIYIYVIHHTCIYVICIYVICIYIYIHMCSIYVYDIYIYTYIYTLMCSSLKQPAIDMFTWENTRDMLPYSPAMIFQVGTNGPEAGHVEYILILWGSIIVFHSSIWYCDLLCDMIGCSQYTFIICMYIYIYIYTHLYSYCNLKKKENYWILLVCSPLLLQSFFVSGYVNECKISWIFFHCGYHIPSAETR